MSGSYEVVSGAQVLLDQGVVDGVIVMGVLIKGDTMHFEYISEAVTQGVMRLNIDYKMPVVYGVLSVFNEEQAKQRAGMMGESSHNHGVDWGNTVVESIALKKKYQCYKKVR